MSNNGVKFEKNIVENYRKPSANFEPEVQSATNLLRTFFSNKKIVHRDEISLKGKGLGREVKADFWIDECGVSVKLNGTIQLSSAEGKGTAKAFRLCYNNICSKLSEAEGALIEELIRIVEDIPTKMVSAANRAKAQQRKPKIAAVATDYDVWSHDVKPQINKLMLHVFENIPQFKLAVVEEMLTGRLQFANTIGVADYILTPDYFGYIDKNYVQKITDCVKIDLRAKSRAGITSGVVRFDAKA